MICHIIFFFFSLIFLSIQWGCNPNKVNVISYELKRTDYVERINAAGTVRASSTLTIVAPRIPRVFNMTVIYLADEGTYVKKGDTICILDAPELMQYYENVSSRLEQTKMDLNKLNIDNIMTLSALESQLENMEIRFALNSLDSVQKQFAPPIQQRLFALELEKTSVEKMKLQKQYAAQKEIYGAELRSINSQIKTAENDLQRVIDNFNSLTILAPQDGIVLHTEVPRFMGMSMMGVMSFGGKIGVNSSVFGNMSLLQMPDVREMEVSAEVPEAEYRRILTGQKVKIHVDALADLKTTGEIKRKTLVGKTPDQQSSIKVYEVIVSIDSLHSLLKPGLSAACEIIVNEVKDTVVVPTLAIFEKDSLNIVFVAKGNKFLPVPVEIGLSNSSGSIVSKGLAGDETIALVEPPHSLIERGINTSEKPSDTPDSLMTVKIKY